MKKKIKIHCEIEVSFEEYKNQSLNNGAERHIRRWIKDMLVEHASFIPICVERDENGRAFEDCTKKTKIKVR